MSVTPRMLAVRQIFTTHAPIDLRATVQAQLESRLRHLKPGARIAVAVGSRGISNLSTIVASLLKFLQSAGAQPFIVPAMGSHGGATPEGQTQLLAEYGISTEHIGVPIRAGMEAEHLGKTEDGVNVFFSREALRSDGVIVVNRIKPHTDFSGLLGSGLVKMLVVGLGKRVGAANFHACASRWGYEDVLRTSARITLRSAPILAGLGIVENQLHETAKVELLLPEEIESREEELFAQAKQWMPRLPIQDIDLLIVDRLGKNISGAGMDPNVIGRGVHGYSSLLSDRSLTPVIRRLFVRELTPETHGNATGIGLADLTTSRLVRQIDHTVTAINALTALAPQSAKIPIHFETDREAIERALESLALADTRQAKVVRIADTLSLEHLEASEACLEELRRKAELVTLGQCREMQFDASHNLEPIAHS